MDSPSFENLSEYQGGLKELFSLFQTDAESSELLSCVLLVRNSKTLLSGGFGSGKNTFVEIAAKQFFGSNLGIVRCHPELTVYDIMWVFNVQKFLAGKVGSVAPRSLITAPFKYLNEIQRLNVQCQNALLSLLTDRVITFGEERADTPDYVCFLDRNPHDIGTIGIVKALLDRVDYHLEVRFLSFKETYALVKAKYKDKHVLDLRDIANQILNAEQMFKIWSDVERVTIPSDLYQKISFMGVLLRKCVRIDRSIASINYRLSCEGCPYLPEICNKLERPLGHRWLDSLVKLGKAHAWLKRRSELTLEDLVWGLPFILSHRLELKQSLFTKFTGEPQWVKEVLIPDIMRKQADWNEVIALMEPAKKGEEKSKRRIFEIASHDLAITDMSDYLGKTGDS